MARVHIALVCFVLQLFPTDGTFTWENCAPAATNIVTIKTLEVSPDPLTLPGELHFTFEGHSDALSPTSLKVTLSRRADDGKVYRIPFCVYNIGTCTYDDTCTLLDTFIQEDYAGVTRLIGDQVKQMLDASGLNSAECPGPAQNVSISSTVNLPAIPSLLSALNLASGDFNARVELIAHDSKAVLFCIDAWVSLLDLGGDAAVGK